MHKGRYIVIDGPPSVGKSAMVELIAAQLQASDIPMQIIEEPACDSVRMEYHTQAASQREEILRANASRLQTLATIRQLVDAGTTCIVERSFLTTLAVQYYGRGNAENYDKINSIIEFAVGGMMPDLLIVLDAPGSVLKTRAEQVAPDASLEPAFIERIRAGYLWEAKQRHFPVVYALGSKDEVFKEVWSYVSQTLGIPPHITKVSAVKSVAEVIAAKPLSKTRQANHQTVESKIAADHPGDKSGVNRNEHPAPLELGGISHLLVPTLYQVTDQPERIRLHDSLQPEQRDKRGHYPYIIPAKLSADLRSEYISRMDEIFKNYADLLSKLTEHFAAQQSNATHGSAPDLSPHKQRAAALLRGLLPLATKTDVALTVSAEEVKKMSRHLSGASLPEARTRGQTLHAEPGDKHATSLPLESTQVKKLERIANELLSSSYSSGTHAVTLAGCHPRNELDIIADMLYPQTDLALVQLQTESADWAYQRKLDIFTTYIGDRASRRDVPGAALESIHYTWEITSDTVTLLDLLPWLQANDFAWQPLSPRMGYETPADIEGAGLADAYDDCFDLSLQLQSTLQADGHTQEAQYAVLLGHKRQWKFSQNARQAFALMELPKNTLKHPGSHALVRKLYEKLSETHPLVGEAMKFVEA